MNEVESEKELEVADSTEVEEEPTEKEEINEDDTQEFTDSNSEEETKEESTSDKESEPKEKKESESKQSDEENSKYAAARRKAEQDVDIKVKEAYEKGKLEAYKGKINPYTNSEIKDLTDVEVYEDMYKLASSGKDPLKDYASYFADKKREENRLASEKAERETKAKKEIEEFSNKYPDVNITSLFDDENFKDYADGKNKSLIEVYESYNKFKNNFRNKGIETAKKTIANSVSSPGSLNNSSDNFIDYENMSREQFLKEVEKVKDR